MKPRHILLVEDNQDDELLTLRALRRLKIAAAVDVARDGAEALHMLDARSYDLVLLDLRLPKVHGLEVLERVRADPRTRTVPVVILTSSNEESDLLRSYDAGVNSYIYKPVDFDAFMRVVSQLGLYWIELNQLPASP